MHLCFVSISEQRVIIFLYSINLSVFITEAESIYCTALTGSSNQTDRGKSPNMGRCPNKGRCIISYQELLCSLLKNVNHQADEAVLCNHSINGQLLRTSVLIGRLCFGAL